jgi:hypothetical protein
LGRPNILWLVSEQIAAILRRAESGEAVADRLPGNEHQRGKAILDLSHAHPFAGSSLFAL